MAELHTSLHTQYVLCTRRITFVLVTIITFAGLQGSSEPENKPTRTRFVPEEPTHKFMFTPMHFDRSKDKTLASTRRDRHRHAPAPAPSHAPAAQPVDRVSAKRKRRAGDCYAKAQQRSRQEILPPESASAPENLDPNDPIVMKAWELFAYLQLRPVHGLPVQLDPSTALTNYSLRELVHILRTAKGQCLVPSPREQTRDCEVEIPVGPIDGDSMDTSGDNTGDDGE